MGAQPKNNTFFSVKTIDRSSYIWLMLPDLWVEYCLPQAWHCKQKKTTLKIPSVRFSGLHWVENDLKHIIFILCRFQRIINQSNQLLDVIECKCSIWSGSFGYRPSLYQLNQLIIVKCVFLLGEQFYDDGVWSPVNKEARQNKLCLVARSMRSSGDRQTDIFFFCFVNVRNTNTFLPESWDKGEINVG